MRSIWTALLTCGVAGATATYFLDPGAGRKRRARARMAVTHARRVATHGFGAAARDFEHRVHGMMSSTTAQTKPYAEGDEVIVARVRSRLGHVCSHPHAIAVACHGGVVALEGPVLEEDVPAVLRAARSTRGARAVLDRLERHDTPAMVPALQGPSRLARRQLGHWPPAARLAIGTAGAGALLAGLSRGGVLGLGTAVLGGIAIARGIANVRVAELGGLRGRRPAIDVEKTMTVNAPVQDVVELFTMPENFPRFMRHVKSVRRIGDNRWVWSVAGPAGVHFEWEGSLQRLVPNELVAWKSEEGASVQNEGSVTFETVAPGTTRLSIRLRYWPPGGLVGHEIARLLGDDPARELDEDMLRLKSLVERGKTTGPGGAVTRDDVLPTSWR